MAEVTIRIREYIGESCYNWETDSFEWATNCDELRWAIEYAGYAGEQVTAILLEIGNCYGGSVDEGLAMFHYLQELGVPIRTRILGTVASMGTILPLCGDVVEVAQTAQFMVHAPSNEFWGTAAEISAGLKGLQGDTASLAAIYVARTGQDAATVAQWMSQDTWFTADEALAAGLCTAVLPLRPKTAAPAPTEAVAKLRRKRFAEAVARADKRTSPSAKTPAAPLTTPAPAPNPAPMAITPKPTPRAAAPATPKAAPAQARKTLFTQLKELFAGIEEGGEATAEAEAADVQSTELDNGAFLYHEGALAQGSLVFNDEALTEATGDGDYDTADDQVISVTAGAVTAIAAADASATTPPATTATARRLDRLEASLGTLTTERDTLKAENERLKKVKPALPTARAARPNAEAPDPKAAPVAQGQAAHHASL